MTEKSDLVVIETAKGNVAVAPEVFEQMDDADDRADAANTRRAYASQQRLWEAWCEDQNLEPYPAAPGIVAAWLTVRAHEGAAPSTLSGALAALRHRYASDGTDLDADEPFERFDGEGMTTLRRVMRGLRRKNARPQKQAKALTPDLLGDVLNELGNDILDRRDAAMLAMLYAFALRRSELTAIDYGVHGTGDAVLTVEDDRAVLELLKSKSSQDENVKVVIGRDANPRAFAAIERWVNAAKIEPGTPLIRRLTPSRTVRPEAITDDGAHRAVKAVMARYYLSTGCDDETAKRLASQFSGHSGRVGFVVAAKSAGAADSDVMATSRHKSPQMVARYGEQANQLSRSAHKRRGVGL